VLAHKERLDNLYVAFAVMLRAVVKAGDAITAAVPPAGAAMGEGRREWETRLLPGIRALGEACPTSFDETSLLEGDGEGLRREMLQARFEHLGRIMRCVGCDRCKLWGTLQARGLRGKESHTRHTRTRWAVGPHHTHTYTPDHVRVRVQVHVHVHVRVSPPCAILV